MKKINWEFKLLYCIGIVFIVAGHVTKNGSLNLFTDFFHYYSFHLALFSFCSGYFYNKANEDNTSKYILKKFKKLIIPLYFWNTIYGLFVKLTKYKDFAIGDSIRLNRKTLWDLTIQPLTNSHAYVYNLSTWFLGPLFFVETINILIRKFTKKIKTNDYIYFILYLCLGMISVHLAYKGYNKNWMLLLDRTLYLLPFYGLGILYKSQLEEKDNIKSWIYFSIILILDLITITINKKVVYYKPSWCNDYLNNVILPFVIGILGIAFWLRIAKIMTPAIENNKMVNLIGSNTYSIMIHQFFAFFIVKYIFGELSKFIPLFSGFNWYKFKTDIWYYFVPNNLSQWYIVYLLVGIFMPILINWILKNTLGKIKKLNFLNGIAWM